jgi:hypothetical protein
MRPAGSRRIVPFGACALAGALLSAGVTALEPRPARAAQDAAAQDLDTVLERASGYVARYFQAMANLTAEERYLQELLGMRAMSTMPAYSPSAMRAAGGRRRDLRSDIVLVNVGPPLEWRVYRDVFEVDGLAVRDRADRLAALFLEPAEAARAQAERIADESARFNISNMGRVLNEPGLPLVFLQPALRPRFRFSLERGDGDEAWIVKYEESGRPTLFWHNRTIENPSAGRYWIDPRTGDITRSEHVVSPPGFKATFVTDFRRDDRAGVALPVEMREQLWTGVQASASRVQGVARYSNYRKFAVLTQ